MWPLIICMIIQNDLFCVNRYIVPQKIVLQQILGQKVEIGYYISIFKEKGLPQDLIDEEQASILSNQEAVEKYQKVIEDLEGEIQKLKEA